MKVIKLILTLLIIAISSLKTMNYAIIKINYDDKIKKILIKDIKRREGLILHSYKCPAGFWTIGYGHQIEDTNLKITKNIAEKLLIKDINRVSEELIKVYKIKPIKAYILSSIAMNIGLNKFKKSKMNISLIENNDSLLYNTLLKYCYYKNNNGKYIRSNNLYISRKNEVFLLKLIKYE